MKNLMLTAFILTLMACGGPLNSDTDPTNEDEELNGEQTYEPLCEEPAEIRCQDSLIADLSLQDEISEGTITNTQDGEDWVTHVDATAGGFMNASQNPFLYMKFTDDGLEKVELDDESALESMEWHLSARRYVVRVNSGTSGPSCVGAAALLNDQYENVTTVPENLSFYSDDFYTESCDIIPDSYGLGDPQVVLVNWWSYESCVKTTLTPFLIELENGRVVKLIVEEYYASGQSDCNDNGSRGDESGNLKIRWSFL